MKNQTATETILNVEGMTCSSCVRHVDHALRALAGVLAVDVKLKDGKVLVQHEEATTTASMIEALDEAGYPSHENRK